MKRLKNKVFWMVFLLLSLFLVSMLILFNYQSYQREWRNISDSLERLYKNSWSSERRNFTDGVGDINANKQIPKAEEFSKRIFVDLIVYTVLLDNNNEIVDVISHDEVFSDKMISSNEAEIRKIATYYLSSDPKEGIKVSNLYFSRYSYAFVDGSYLIIIDNEEVKVNLLANLRLSLVLFGLLEVVIFYLATLITKWIIVPVNESFERQRQFIADASHELKTPLAVIIASSEALESDRTTDKWLLNIQNEANRMNGLISDLLNLTRLEARDKKVFSNVNLSKVIEIEVLSFESLIFEKNLKLAYDIKEDIYYLCDSNQMKQLVAILLDNAIKHSYVKKTIAVKLDKVKEEIILTVSNYGETIPKEEYEKIFERFYRIDKARNRKENRYGLGLSIAKSIVINHDGKISVSSKEELTTFKVSFKTVNVRGKRNKENNF